MADGDPDKAIEAEIERLERDAERMKAVAREAEDVAREDEADLEKLERELRERRIALNVVVNGAPVVIDARRAETLAHVRDKALKDTGNVGQPPDKWEIKDEAGTVLDPERTVGSYDLCDGATLFVSLKAGAAGGA